MRCHGQRGREGNLAVVEKQGCLDKTKDLAVCPRSLLLSHTQIGSNLPRGWAKGTNLAQPFRANGHEKGNQIYIIWDTFRTGLRGVLRLHQGLPGGAERFPGPKPGTGLPCQTVPQTFPFRDFSSVGGMKGFAGVGGLGRRFYVCFLKLHFFKAVGFLQKWESFQWTPPVN